MGKTASFKAWIADASTFERFGNLYAEQQEHLLAVDAFGEAVSRALVPKVSLWFSLALSSAAIHQLQKAVVCAQNALALEPDNVVRRESLAPSAYLPRALAGTCSHPPPTHLLSTPPRRFGRC